MEELPNIRKEGVDELDYEIEQENTRKVEAALFIAGRYMNIGELVALTEVNPILLKRILVDLKEKYKDSGIAIVQNENTYKMDVAEEFTWLVNKLATGSAEFTKAEQETLAMIAYKQPMKQSVVIKIRGNKAYDHIHRFVEMGLVTKKKIGHTSELSLSESFYDYFHLTKGDKLE